MYMYHISELYNFLQLNESILVEFIEYLGEKDHLCNKL